MPSNTTAGSVRMRAISNSSGPSGATPVRCSPLSTSSQTRKGTPVSLAWATTALAMAALSRKKLNIGAAAISAVTRASLSGVRHRAHWMSERPAAAKYSASFRVETAMPPCSGSIASRAASTDFSVFICGRSRTPRSRIRWIIQAVLVLSRARSRMTAGVGTSASFIYFQGLSGRWAALGRAVV